MKTIIFCLLIILVFSGYMAFTQDKQLPGIPAISEIKRTPETTKEYIIEITEEEEDE
jgi:hypothetical protein